jgi:predicted  nucleic acid-binding Zn-ribbon protein
MSEHVDQHSSDITPLRALEAKSLETSLKALWDRTKRAGELIVQLREDRTGLRRRVDELEQEIVQLKEEVSHKEELIKKISAEPMRPSGKNGVVLSDGERRQLGARVKELLAKIEGYL